MPHLRELTRCDTVWVKGVEGDKPSSIEVTLRDLRLNPSRTGG